MEKIRNLIIEYLKETIATKRGMKKRIYQLENDVKEARKNEEYAIEQMNKYKQKLRNKKKKENKKLCK